MRRVIFDIEGNGYLHNITKLWCCVATDLDTNVTRRYSPLDWDEAVRYLQSADILYGHNIIVYDLPAIWKVHGDWDSCPLIVDTLVISYALLPERKGGHSLKAWGQRTGTFKGEFEEFDQYSQEMLEYCEQDVITNIATLKALEDEYGSTFPGYKVY